jgi:hypothetical protein
MKATRTSFVLMSLCTPILFLRVHFCALRIICIIKRIKKRKNELGAV